MDKQTINNTTEIIETPNNPELAQSIPMENKDEPHPISPYYTLWFHDLNDKSWNIKSYKKIAEIRDLDTFWKIYNKIETFNNGMFFLMRENILPTWEDKQNVNGGVWSFRLSRKVIDSAWNELSMALIGGTLVDEDKIKETNTIITGISISPKIYNCIFKIWNGDAKNHDASILNNLEHIDVKRCMYKKHK